ncbi:alpha/beta fold hydrolase [Chloroflexota bacterium]
MPKIEVNGVNIDCDVYGTGSPLVLVHGFSGSKDTWKNQIPEFSKYYQVIVMSHRGHGDSDKPLEEEYYSVPVIADDIHTLLKKLNIRGKVIILGHSFGSRVTIQYCLSYPEQIKAAILFGTKTNPAPSGPDKRLSFDNLIRDAQEKGIEKFFDDIAHLWFSPEADPEFVRANTVDSYKVPLHTVIGILKSGLAANYTDDDISKLDMPTLVVVGESDKPTPLEDAEKINRLLPDSCLKIIKGAGHMAHVEKPEVFNRAVLNFLKKLP